MAFNKTLHADQHLIGFGEISLLFNIKRTATVSASSECEVWYVQRDEFQETIGTDDDSEKVKKLAYLDRLRLFDPLTLSQKFDLLRSL